MKEETKDTQEQLDILATQTEELTSVLSEQLAEKITELSPKYSGLIPDGLTVVEQLQMVDKLTDIQSKEGTRPEKKITQIGRPTPVTVFPKESKSQLSPTRKMSNYFGSKLK